MTESGRQGGVVSRLLNDLRRPMGGWTVGFATLFGTIVAVFAAGVHWIGYPIALALFVLHLMWGSAGYYPRRI